MTEPLEYLPEARREGIVTREVDGELLVYDLTRDKAHCLNPTAALVWKSCNGRRDVDELARSLGKELGRPVDKTIVQLTLNQLSSNHLLTKKFEVPLFAPDLSRRALVTRLGVAAVLLPLITTITAPTALANVSCGQPCTGGPGQGSCPSGCVCSPVTSRCTVAP
ncbi:MAG TPA: PqqD family protein [Pyrinomonadaceae bacterium]|nr:PqqD family protein [Pyrinomonadaceae bacterium]